MISLSTLFALFTLTGTIGKFNNQFLAAMLDRLNCPAIVARAFIIPGVSNITDILISLLHGVFDRVKR